MSDGGHVWWEDAVVYEVYPRSFADADGDGVGDLPGLRSRLGYLADLGVDAIWLTPFYPSPLADGGYDVSDYCAVDPRLGTMADFDALVSGAAAHQIRVIIDLVPNHCSSAHPLFQAALAAAPGSPERPWSVHLSATSLRFGSSIGCSCGRPALIFDRPLMRAGHIPSLGGSASVLRCRQSPVLAVGRCCCCQLRIGPDRARF